MADTDRRTLLKTLVLAPLASAAKPVHAGWFGGDNAPDDTLSALNKFDFTGQGGERTSINALARTLKGKPFTVSFAFAGCSQAHIQMHQTLSGLENVAPDIVHVVIDTNPQLDNLGQHARDGLVQELKERGKLQKNIIMLYPSPTDLASIQETVGLIPIPQPISIVAIALYGRDGKKIGIKSTEQNSPQSIIDGWNGPLSVRKR